MKTLCLLFLFSVGFLTAEYPQNHILYLMQAGNSAESLQLYRDTYEQEKRHDFDLIQQMGLILLDQGFRSGNTEIQILTMFGAGISMNERAFYILESGLASPIPEMQGIALNFLAKQENDLTNETLNRAMRSDSPLIRLEAAFHLCKKQHALALDQTESLMAKLPVEAYPLFPQLIAQLGDKRALIILRKMLSSSNEALRIAALQAIIETHRDDCLPQIRQLSSHPHPAQQEACSAGLGVFLDTSSTKRLEQLSKSPSPYVKLAALFALYQLGQKTAANQIIQLAETGDLYAIYLMGSIEGDEELLLRLQGSDSIQVRINAAAALLKKRNPAALKTIGELLFPDSRDVIFTEMNSPGGSLHALRAIPSGHQRYPDESLPFELSLHIREEILSLALELPEKDFLQVADAILSNEQNDLIPHLTQLLISTGTQEAILLLKKHQQKAGAPLVRGYCNLALFKLKVPGPYADVLKEWVSKQQNVDLIHFRPLLPYEVRGCQAGDCELTAHERSRLLIETFEAFANMQEDKGINLLLEVIHNGNPKNKYALAGLLMRAGQ